MYYYVNGKKTRRNPTPIQHKESLVAPVREHLQDNGNGGGKKCPTWVFIVLGIVAALIAAWLIYCIVNVKKTVTSRSPTSSKSESSV